MGYTFETHNVASNTRYFNIYTSKKQSHIKQLHWLISSSKVILVVFPERGEENSKSVTGGSGLFQRPAKWVCWDKKRKFFDGTSRIQVLVARVNKAILKKQLIWSLKKLKLQT